MKGAFSVMLSVLLLASVPAFSFNTQNVHYPGQNITAFGSTASKGTTVNDLVGTKVRTPENDSMATRAVTQGYVTTDTSWQVNITDFYLMVGGYPFNTSRANSVSAGDVAYFTMFLQNQETLDVVIEINVTDVIGEAIGWNTMACRIPPPNSGPWSLGVWIPSDTPNGTATATAQLFSLSEPPWMGGSPISAESTISFQISSSVRAIVVPDDYATIQAAINAANPNDIVYVRNGTYHENVVVNKTVSLIGENTQNTIIDARGVGSVLTIISDYTNVTGFTIRNSSATYAGILDSANNCNISGNNIMNNNNAGIILDSSSNNSISENNITANNNCGIALFSSSNSSVSGNSIANNWNGIYLDTSSNNSVSGNNITANNWDGIELEFSSNYNNVSGNTFTNDSLYVWTSSYQNSVEDNTVNGRPLVYLEGVSNYTVADAGQVVLVNCENITVEGLNLSRTDFGIELYETSNCTISGDNIANNYDGVDVESSLGNIISGDNITDNGYGIVHRYSSNSSISGNNITANSWVSIELFSSSNNSVSENNIANNQKGIVLLSSLNNSIFHNNFVNNNIQAYSSGSPNVWDDGYPGGGNYWSDYHGIDWCHGPSQNVLGSDGIGDTPYVIDVNNTDCYPLMRPWPQQPTSYSWPMFHHDLTHSGYSASTAPRTNNTLWASFIGEVLSSPAVADGLVFVGSDNWDRIGNVYALNESTGSKIWSYVTGGVVFSSPAVADGMVFIGSEDGNVYAFGIATAPNNPSPRVGGGHDYCC